MAGDLEQFLELKLQNHGNKTARSGRKNVHLLQDRQTTRSEITPAKP